jgi:hypothetical protein
MEYTHVQKNSPAVLYISLLLKFIECAHRITVPKMITLKDITWQQAM